MAQPIFNISLRKVGGIRFLKLGRVNISFCVSRPKCLLETQRMSDTKYREAVRLAEIERELTARMAELAENGFHMEVNHDHRTV